MREIHNISVLQVDGRTEVSLHLKLPGDLPLEEAHRVASEVERAIEEAVPGVDTVQTHLEPLAEEAEGRRAVDADGADVEAVTGSSPSGPAATPREVRFLETDEGLVVFLTLGLDLVDARRGARAREPDRGADPRGVPGVSEIIVHTEP